MKSTHTSMDNDTVQTVAWNARQGEARRSSSTSRGTACFAVKALSAGVMLAFGVSVHALPQGGVVAAGTASIAGGSSNTTITQTTANAVINWQSFSIGAGQAVQFIQPGANAVTLNRVLGADPSSIMGSLSANGQVFLLNPNGVLFGSGSSVNVGGLVASTLGISDASFMAGQYALSNTGGTGTVLNQGTLTAAEGGYVALLGRDVKNQGVISARMGTVLLAAGNAMTLDLGGDGLLNVSVTQGAVNALVDNGGLIRAAGGRVLLTTQGAGNLLQTVVNNTGVIEAQTLSSRSGQILLLGDMQSGTMNVGGTLDASAPNGGNGGFIETSAANVRIGDGVRVTTAAPGGLMGTWLIDPQDFIIGAGGNISGATLSGQLVTNNINIVTQLGPGNGDIFVNQAVSWTASGAPTTLTLTASRDVNINAAVTAVDGNFAVCCGRDINVNGAISITEGSLLLSAGRNVNQNAAITVTDGNLAMCAANDVNINRAITLTRGTSDPTRSLGLSLGMTLRADTDGSGPGVAGGTIVFSPTAPLVTVDGPNAPVNLFYNPISYTSPSDFSNKFTLTDSLLTQKMLVFPEVVSSFGGAVSLAGLKGNPANVSLIADPGNTATFDTFDAGVNKTVSFTGYRLGGPDAARFALASSCCSPVAGKTTGSLLPSFPLVAGASLALLNFYGGELIPGGVPSYGEGDLYLPVGEAIESPKVTELEPEKYIAPRYAPRPQRN